MARSSVLVDRQIDQILEWARINPIRRTPDVLGGRDAHRIAVVVGESPKRIASALSVCPPPAPETPHRLPDSDAIALAENLWRLGWGTELQQDVAAYLADIPSVPTFPANYRGRFPYLVLVDRRIGCVRACELLGIQCSATDVTFAHSDSNVLPSAPVYWMRCQYGIAHRNHLARECRSHPAPDEIGLDTLEGLAFYAQYPELFPLGSGMDLIGSMRVCCAESMAYIARWSGGHTTLSRHSGAHANPALYPATRGDSRGRCMLSHLRIPRSPRPKSMGFLVQKHNTTPPRVGRCGGCNGRSDIEIEVVARRVGSGSGAA